MRNGIFPGLAVAGLLLAFGSSTVSAAPDCTDPKHAEKPVCTDSGGDDDGADNTGNGQDTPVDVYLYHVAPYGILGDGWLTYEDATLYPANNTLSGEFSCARAILTDQAQGSVRMFVPAGTPDPCTAPNRFLRIRSDYDLDQDGLCVIPYTGRSDSRDFTLYYECVGPEPDGLEEVMVTMHLNEVLGPGLTTPVSFLIRLLEYRDYEPTAGNDPGLSDIELIGSQERAFVVTLIDGATTQDDAEDGNGGARIFFNTIGNANICEVVWKNAHAHDCVQIVDGNGDPVVITGMTIMGKVDPTPLP